VDRSLSASARTEKPGGTRGRSPSFGRSPCFASGQFQFSPALVSIALCGSRSAVSGEIPEAWRCHRERRASSPICRCISSFPPPFRLRRWTELNNSSARGAARGACHAWGDARADRAWACVDYNARFAGARCCYQSHTMRALWTVADLTNALQVKLRVAARSADIGRPVGDADDVAAMSRLHVRVDNGPGRREAACRQLGTWRYRNSGSKSC